MDTQNLVRSNGDTGFSTIKDMKMLGSYGPSRHSTLVKLDQWVLRDVFNNGGIDRP